MTLQAEAGKHRVVLVDDTRDLRELLRMALMRGGFDVVGEAGDGREGIEVCDREHPDVVLLDLAMPVMDGIEALPEIRRLCPAAVIVVLSGFGAQQLAARAVAAGADGYVQKGAPLKKILAYVRALIDDDLPRPAAALSLVRGRDDPPPGPGAAPRGSTLTASPGPSVTAAASWAQPAVALAPYGVMEVADLPRLPLVAANAAAGRLLDVTVLGVPLASVAAELAVQVDLRRSEDKAAYEVHGPRGPLRVSQRRTDGSIVLFLDVPPDDVRLLRRAIATTAHEIRGPVTVLGGVAETVGEMDDMAVEDRRRMMRSVARQTRLLDGITADLLTAAQIQRGNLRLDLQTIDPAVAVADVAEDDFDVTVRVVDSRPVRADPLRFEQMLTNLLRNAVKHGAAPIEVVVRSCEGSDAISVDVVDHGPGVPEDFQHRLFTEFARADDVAVTGTGLGLFVVRTLAEAQHGSVSYRTGDDGGAVFGICLPVADDG